MFNVPTWKLYPFLSGLQSCWVLAGSCSDASRSTNLSIGRFSIPPLVFAITARTKPSLGLVKTSVILARGQLERGDVLSTMSTMSPTTKF